MKILLIVLFSVNFIVQPNIDTIREAFKEAGKDNAKIIYFNSLTANVSIENNNATLVAYKGAALTLQAKIAKKVKEKKTLFKEGVAYIEKAIKKNPDEIETRFIRLVIQENTPEILKYKSKIEEDKEFVLAHFDEIESPLLKKDIKAYIVQSGTFNNTQK
ncbi:hypothetical protein [Galbibacter sp. PAP.153]|uniref:hypothetical protein n=1 Tax=Galbibacter sp. PAP.153 TaxID=3104623 RepID=UPI00300B85DD